MTTTDTAPYAILSTDDNTLDVVDGNDVTTLLSAIDPNSDTAEAEAEAALTASGWTVVGAWDDQSRFGYIANLVRA